LIEIFAGEYGLHPLRRINNKNTLRCIKFNPNFIVHDLFLWEPVPVQLLVVVVLESTS
jgi:hypothetical protein